jgi:DNA-binding winged helix-turn-helix (wHTH) protein
MNTPRVFEFDPFRLDTGRRLLLRNGVPVTLKPKAFDLLVMLVENSDRVVEKEELISHLWPNTAVEENNLTVQKRALVAVLGDGYIRTIPRHGYRFVAAVRNVTDEADSTLTDRTHVESTIARATMADVDGGLEPDARPSPTHSAAARPLHNSKRKKFVLAGIAALIVLIVSAVVWQRAANRSTTAGARQQIRSPSDEAEVMRVVKESQMLETLKIYTHPESFDHSQLDKYWLSAEQGGKAIAQIEAAVKHLRDKGWRYSDDSRLDIFDFRYVRIFSPRDYAEVGTSERWYVPTVRADGSRVENRNVYLGVYDVDYTLRKVGGHWLLEGDSTPRAKSTGNENK